MAADAFFQQLEIQLQDHRLARDGVTRELYFDTFDVRRALLGMWDYAEAPYVNPLAFALEKFKHETALIAALMDSGYLGCIHVLPPHQAELRRHLVREEFSDSRRWSELPENDFFRALGLLQSDDAEPASAPRTLTQLSEPQLAAIVNRHSNEAPRLFKAVQCVRHTWWKRLKLWEQDQRLRLSLPGFHASQLTLRKEFPKVVDGFAAERRSAERSRGRGASDPRAAAARPPAAPDAGSGSSFNDFADAVALLALVQLVEDHRAGARRTYPRFYDSFGTFRRVADRTGLSDRLRIITPDKLETPVLVDGSYFLYTASVRSSGAGEPGLVPGGVLNIEELYTHVSAATRGDAPVPEGIRRRIEDSKQLVERSVVEAIKHLKDVGFLSNVWLRTRALSDLQDTVARLRETPESRSSEYKEVLHSVIRRYREVLDKGTEEYVLLRRFWLGAEQQFHQLREAHHRSQRMIDPIREYALSRFCLTEPAAAAIRRIFEDLLDPDAVHDLDGGHEDGPPESEPGSAARADIAAQPFWRDLIASCCDALRDPELHADHAEIAAVILWWMHALDDVIVLLRPYVEGPRCRPSLRLMFCAACLDSRHNLAPGEPVFAALQAEHAAGRREFERTPSMAAFAPYVRLAAGVAYLHFHLWRIQRGDWDWRNLGFQFSALPAAARATAERAIACATDACRAFSNMRQHGAELDHDLLLLEKYLQNQRLYYLVELGDPSRDNDIQAAYDAISDIDAQVWTRTFDDTLARYFHYRALWTDERDAWFNLMRSAIEKASRPDGGGPSDRRYQDFRDRLHSWNARGFEAREKFRPADAAPPR